MSWKIPYFSLHLDADDEQAVIDAVRSNWLTTGPRIEQFESDFADALGQPKENVIAVTNCTAALHLATACMNFGPGDEVIVTPITFVASANAIRYVGAAPVFADICVDDDFTISPEDIARKITPRTKGIVIVHYGGYSCHMEEIMALAEKHDLRVIEDNAHGPTGKWRDRYLGTIGDVGCFSFFSNKNMTTGEGGMVVVREAAVAKRMRILRSHGMSKSSYERFKGEAFRYDVAEVGWNYRMDELRAALGISQLAKLPKLIAARSKVVRWYKDILAEQLPDLTVPFARRNEADACHIFPILLPIGADRDDIMYLMSKWSVQTSVHYAPIHKFAAYHDIKAVLPITEKIAPRILSLPLYGEMSKDDCAYVVAALKDSLEKSSHQG
jgi:dTDP-4-amino-4,6-dideoxygalactose transaminase